MSDTSYFQSPEIERMFNEVDECCQFCRLNRTIHSQLTSRNEILPVHNSLNNVDGQDCDVINRNIKINDVLSSDVQCNVSLGTGSSFFLNFDRDSPIKNVVDGFSYNFCDLFHNNIINCCIKRDINEPSNL